MARILIGHTFENPDENPDFLVEMVSFLGSRWHVPRARPLGVIQIGIQSATCSALPHLSSLPSLCREDSKCHGTVDVHCNYHTY